MSKKEPALMEYLRRPARFRAAKDLDEIQSPCQVRSGTERPCPRPAVVRVRGVPFCEPCAGRQEAYFAIGELTEEPEGLRDEPLVKLLGRLRRPARRPEVRAGMANSPC